MNLVRGYLLVDQPAEADSTLRAGSPGDEIAALVLGPALAARIALRHGRLSEAERQATAALAAARAFGVDNRGGASDAHLALAGALIDRNELADATTALRRLEEILLSWPEGRVYQVLLRLEKARVAAALDDFDDVFATLREAGMLIAHLPRSALPCLVDAAAARWHLQAGQTHQAEELIGALPEGGPAHTLLRARLDLGRGRFDAVRARLQQASLTTMRDQLTGELLLARAAIESGDDAGEHVRLAAGLAAPERLVRVFLEDGPAVARLARAAAESLGTESGTDLSVALGAPSPSRSVPHQPTTILTERELSVLRYLPSRLTNAEIASECFVFGEHGQKAPQEHLHEAKGLLACGGGRAGPAARPVDEQHVVLPNPSVVRGWHDRDLPASALAARHWCHDDGLSRYASVDPLRVGKTLSPREKYPVRVR
jgi:LuxR family maltose regulon positive regulatory protein